MALRKEINGAGLDMGRLGEAEKKLAAQMKAGGGGGGQGAGGANARGQAGGGGGGSIIGNLATAGAGGKMMGGVKGWVTAAAVPFDAVESV